MISNQIEKKQKIKWDEETIAEHDKERGTRQKIDEAPTPYRYLSESESESDADCLKLANKKSLKDSPQRNVAFCDSPSSNTHNSISDSWEIINAKLLYEKHLQDINDQNNNNLLSTSPSLYTLESTTSLEMINVRNNQRKEFYLDNNDCDTIRDSEDFDSSNATNSSHNNPTWKQYRGNSHHNSNKISIKIDDLQTNFGEILNHPNPAPAAFSPQFTRKQYRPNNYISDTINNNNQLMTNAHNTTENNSIPKPVPQIIVKPRTVFIPVSLQDTIIQDNMNSNDIIVEEDNLVYPSSNTIHENISSQSDNTDHNKSRDKDKFLNKRAGHYNEYKVLQAMRAKLAAEEDEDEDECV